jgi:hypothetical protein
MVSWRTPCEWVAQMPPADLPDPASIRDYRLLEPHVRRTARETWLDPDWLWNFCKGMQQAGQPTERIMEAMERQRLANRLSLGKRLFRWFHLKFIRGFRDY